MTRLEGIPSGSQVAGVDEVGRGCLFGPVFAAAVVLDRGRRATAVASGSNG
jgi:ribonuclease HII